jgi:hypothetical protein
MRQFFRNDLRRKGIALAFGEEALCKQHKNRHRRSTYETGKGTTQPGEATLSFYSIRIVPHVLFLSALCVFNNIPVTDTNITMVFSREFRLLSSAVAAFRAR